MPSVTRILSDIERGDASSAEQLLPLVYKELRKLAAARLAKESGEQTLPPTALVHEAYLRLVDNEQAQHWDSRGHFFSAAAEAMRRILVERARRRARPKHGGDRCRVELQEHFATEAGQCMRVLAVNEALEALQKEDATKAQLVKLRYFAGMSLEEAAAAMNISRATAARYWTVAKAWLSVMLEDINEIEL